MSYLLFHIFFILPPIVLLALTAPRPLSVVGRRAGLGILLIALVALVYTTPWDNYLIAEGVWSYEKDLIVGTVGYVPVEEYLFFLLQPLLAGLWLYRLLAKNKGRYEGPSQNGRVPIRLLGTVGWLVLGLAAVMALQWDRGYYLGLILVWATPVLAVQWAYGGRFFWSVRGTWLLGITVPTVYLWLADRVALGFGIWRVSDVYTIGFEPLGLPVEEAVFFLMTNILVVQGLLAFLLWTSRRPGKRVVGSSDGRGHARSSHSSARNTGPSSKRNAAGDGSPELSR